jgi:hypothetical protein
MHSSTQTAPASKGMLWAGPILTALVALFLLFDSAIKLMKQPAAVQRTARVGYPEGVVVPIGIVLLVCLVLYLIPRTAILGAILLTGYLGGATATVVRMSDPWFFFPVVVGVPVWTGLYLRDDQVRALIRVRS